MPKTSCSNFKQVAFADLPAEFDKAAIVSRIGKKAAEANKILVRIRCKKWECEYCAEINRRMWRGFLHRRIHEMGQRYEWQMMTLTPTSAALSQKQSYEQLRVGAEKLMKRILRVHGVHGSIEYVRVYEAFESNAALHLHYIISGLSPFIAIGCNEKLVYTEIATIKRNWKIGFHSLQTWLKNNAKDCGLGFMADIRPIPTPEAVNYVTKYLTKKSQGIQIKGIRRIATSKGIGSPKKVSSELLWDTAYGLKKDYINEYDIVADITAKRVIDVGYFENYEIYPEELC